MSRESDDEFIANVEEVEDLDFHSATFNDSIDEDLDVIWWKPIYNGDGEEIGAMKFAGPTLIAEIYFDED